MKDTLRVFRLFVALAALALVVACDSGDSDEPGPDVQGQEDIATSTGACHACLEVGMGFRFSGLDVIEPSEPPGLPDFLNGIWKPDVDDKRLNIMLQITEIVDNGDGTKNLTFKAGSAWHDLAFDDVLPVPNEATPASYHFVGPEPTEFMAVLQADCTFATIGDSNSLLFHPGPDDHALICSHGDDGIGLPKDTIPIANLVATGQIADSCEGMVDGHLDGAIAEEAAGQICSFFAAPYYDTWSYSEDDTVEPVNFKNEYCFRWCGRAGWANFGLFTRTIDVPLTADSDGDGTNDAIGLSGDWTATLVTVVDE